MYPSTPLSWMDCPEFADPVRQNIFTAIKTEINKFIEPAAVTDWPDITSPTEEENNINVPLVNGAAAINNGLCKIFAERVHIRLEEPDNIEIRSDADRHTWLIYDGLHFDAQDPHGVQHPSELSVYSGK